VPPVRQVSCRGTQSCSNRERWKWPIDGSASNLFAGPTPKQINGELSTQADQRSACRRRLLRAQDAPLPIVLRRALISAAAKDRSSKVLGHSLGASRNSRRASSFEPCLSAHSSDQKWASQTCKACLVAFGSAAASSAAAGVIWPRNMRTSGAYGAACCWCGIVWQNSAYDSPRDAVMAPLAAKWLTSDEVRSGSKADVSRKSGDVGKVPNNRHRYFGAAFGGADGVLAVYSGKNPAPITPVMPSALKPFT
jgi:hypothetical protein